MNNIPIGKEELKPFMQRSDSKGLRIIVWTWMSIFSIFALAAIAPFWPVYILCIFLLAGRLQALAALMHETAHSTLFATKKWNTLVCNWFTAPFILMDGDTYFKCHLEHHRNAGTNQDPDLPNYKNYPVTRASLWRKLARDITGITGVKLFAYLLLSGNDSLSRKKRAPGTLLKGICMNFVLFSILWLSGHPELFALWVVAYFTVYLLIVRVRQIAEHAAVKDLFDVEPKYNTRSVPRGIIGMLFVSPIEGLSYHCEHHAFMAVPTYNLKALHRKLKANGYYDDIVLHTGYLSVLRGVVRT